MFLIDGRILSVNWFSLCFSPAQGNLKPVNFLQAFGQEKLKKLEAWYVSKMILRLDKLLIECPTNLEFVSTNC